MMSGNPIPTRPEVAGVILAGGRGRRMAGGDKLSAMLGGRTLLARAVERARPQVARLVINANGEAARLAGYGLPLLPDTVGDFAGPLAGVLAGLEWAATLPGCRWLATFPADAPFLPADLVSRLSAAAEAGGTSLALARSGGRLHPVFGVWALTLRDGLRRSLIEEGLRKVEVWTARQCPAMVDYTLDPLDPFFNVNSPADLAEAERLLPLFEATGRTP